jgi:hypothetical protein
MEQLENAYTDGTVQLDTSILMSKAENKYAELIESTNSPAAARRRKTTRCSPDRARSPQGILHKFQSGGKPPRRKEVAQVVTPINQVDQCPTQEGEPQSKTIGGKDYHWCVGNNAHKPKWVRHEPSSAVDLTIRRKDVAKPASESKKESAIKDAKSVKWSSAMRATLV